MFKRIHQKLGTAGFVIAIVALVAALGGTAFAAAKLNGTQKKEVEKIAKKYAGKPGANGAPGPVGPAGPKGDTGAAGANGSNGASGATGAKGTTGATGATGQTGFTETLPPGKTETGNWIIAQAALKYREPAGEISFPIPLSAPSTKVVYLTQSQTENSVTTPIEGCELDVNDIAATPVAPPGVLCVFTRDESIGEVNSITAFPSASASEPVGDAPTGAYIVGTPLEYEGELGLFELAGTWAVTAPTS